MSSNYEDVLFLIKNIEQHTTKKGNDCLKVHGYSTSESRSYTLWVFNEDWMQDLENRKDQYIDNEFEVCIDDKTGGSRHHVWAIYFWPAEPELQQDWYDMYLKSNGYSLNKRSDEEVEKILQNSGYEK